MADLYNLTQLQEATTIDKLVLFANEASEGILFVGFIISLFIIMLLALRRWGMVDAMLTSSFVCFVISLIATYAGWIGALYPLSFLAITAFTGLFVFLRKS